MGDAAIALACAVSSRTANARYRTRSAYMRPMATSSSRHPPTSASERTRERAGSRTLRSTRLPGEAKAVPGCLPSPPSWPRTRWSGKNRRPRGSRGSKGVPTRPPLASRVATPEGTCRRRTAVLAAALPAGRRAILDEGRPARVPQAGVALVDPGRGDGRHQRPARERVTEMVEQLYDDPHHSRDMQGGGQPQDEARNG